MSRTADIFVISQQKIEDFLQDIEAILNLKFEKMSDSWETWYEFRTAELTFTLGNHNFENDRDMDFEKYQYDLSVKVLNSKEPDHQSKCYNFAHEVFEKLKATGKYALMLVDDLQLKLDEFVPGVSF